MAESFNEADKYKLVLVDIVNGLSQKLKNSPALTTPHELAVLNRCLDALELNSAIPRQSFGFEVSNIYPPRRNCDKFISEAAAWQEYKMTHKDVYFDLHHYVRFVTWLLSSEEVSNG